MPMAKKSRSPAESSRFTDEEIPFVPAFDLLTTKTAAITPEAVVAIGTALFAVTSGPDAERHNTAWESTARFEAITRRF